MPPPCTSISPPWSLFWTTKGKYVSKWRVWGAIDKLWLRNSWFISFSIHVKKHFFFQVYLPMFVKSSMYESYQNHLKKTLRHTEDMKSCSSRSSLSLEENLPLVETRPSPNNTIERSESKLNLFEESNLEDFWFKPMNRHSELGWGQRTICGILAFRTCKVWLNFSCCYFFRDF